MLSAVISVSPDSLYAPAGYSLTALDRFLGLPVASYHFLPPIQSAKVCQKSLLSELIYALVGKTLPTAAKRLLMSQRQNVSHAA